MILSRKVMKMYKLFIVEDDEGIASEVKNLAAVWSWKHRFAKTSEM